MKELIYNQNDIPKEQWRYGFRSSAAVGCGWVATHNALRLMGYETDIPELIRYYERQLPLIHGNAGTSFWGPGLLFRQWGFPVKVSIRPGEYDALAREADACILFYQSVNKLPLPKGITPPIYDLAKLKRISFPSNVHFCPKPEDVNKALDGALKK